jgi:hypothetical protein
MSPLKTIPTDAVFIVFLLIFFFIGLVRQLEGEQFTLFVRSFANMNLVDQQLRQERAFSRLAVLLFILVMAIIPSFLALFLHQNKLFLDFSFIGLFSAVFISLIIITTARVAFYSILAWVFNLELLQQHYTFHWLLTNVILCMVLLPITIAGVFGPTPLQSLFLDLGFWVLIGFYLLRVLRIGYVTSATFLVPFAYNFLYICALEFLPLLVTATVISRQIG